MGMDLWFRDDLERILRGAALHAPKYHRDYLVALCMIAQDVGLDWVPPELPEPQQDAGGDPDLVTMLMQSNGRTCVNTSGRG